MGRTVPIYMNKDIETKLNEIANHTGKLRSRVVQEMIRDYKDPVTEFKPAETIDPGPSPDGVNALLI